MLLYNISAVTFKFKKQRFEQEVRQSRKQVHAFDIKLRTQSHVVSCEWSSARRCRLFPGNIWSLHLARDLNALCCFWSHRSIEAKKGTFA